MKRNFLKDTVFNPKMIGLASVLLALTTSCQNEVVSPAIRLQQPTLTQSSELKADLIEAVIDFSKFRICGRLMNYPSKVQLMLPDGAELNVEAIYRNSVDMMVAEEKVPKLGVFGFSLETKVVVSHVQPNGDKRYVAKDDVLVKDLLIEQDIENNGFFTVKCTDKLVFKSQNP